jgi:predicted MPP superfamily phosphohydrolase
MFKSRLIGMSFFVIFFLAIDVYAWFGLKFITQHWSERSRLILKWVYWGYTAIMMLFWTLQRFDVFALNPQVLRFVAVLFFSITIAKLIWALFLMFDDLLRLFRWIYAYFFTDNTETPNNPAGMTRLKFLNYLGLGIGAAFVGTAIWGVVKGAHNYQIKRRTLSIKGLPKAFEGLRIVQISDVHSGSFWSREAVARGIDMIKAEKADMVFFTGDLVNDRSDEVLPWMDLFGQIKAPMGVYSILGNHDYGDYVPWPSPEAKMKNLEDLISYHKQMGWDILLDEHRVVEKDGEKLGIIGVENWSAKGRFPKYGDLAKASQGLDTSVQLLLSHDPSHWREQVLGKTKIAATFSGHTHGMQFGVDTKFYRWSPVKMVYKEWLDLYTEKDQHLYVNRGFGYLGYPGRMGIFPEISVHTLTGA